MKTRYITLATVFLITGYLLTACGAGVARGQVRQNTDGSIQVEVTGTPEATNDNQATETSLSETETPDVNSSSSAGSSSSSSGSSSSVGTETPDAAQAHREFVGTVESKSGDQWTVSGQSFTVTSDTEIKGTIVVGTVVRVHAIVNADGTFTATEIEAAQADATPGWDDNNGSSSSASSDSSSSSSSVSSTETSSSSSSASATESSSSSSSSSSASSTETSSSSSSSGSSSSDSGSSSSGGGGSGH